MSGVILLELLLRGALCNGREGPHVFKFLGVQRASAMEVNVHVRL